MIRVELQPEPETFDARVRRPGMVALEENREPLPPYWRECLDDLQSAYRNVCAYLSVHIPHGTGARSTDHFAAKSKQRELAYEWKNYRLACQLMNARKNRFDDVLDPFEIDDGSFILELSFMQVLPNPHLDSETQARVIATIQRLDLNDRECTAARALYYDAYLAETLSFGLLEQWSPFVAREVKRQGGFA